MSAISNKKFLNILFISSQADVINEIKDYLSTSNDLSYHVEHRHDLFGSTDLLLSEDAQIDVILLDMQLFGSSRSREIFQRMLTLAHDIPIIVYTDPKDQAMADMAILDGAAGSIARGDFGLDTFKFHDVVAFAAERAEAKEASFAEALNTPAEIELVRAVKEISNALKSVDFKNAILVSPMKYS